MFKGQKCLVIGSGISGVGAVSMLGHMGADITLFDGGDKITQEELEAKVPQGVQAKCYVRQLPEELLSRIEVAVLSPGVPTDIPLVQELKTRGTRIIGEIELGFLAEQGRVAAITGTNGKTTTTTLVGEIMKANMGPEKVFVVGNIGNPYTLEAEKTGPDTVTVGELSSFQLETVDTFRPRVSAILNITPDHLNRHHTMEAYVEAKERIAMRQTSEEICVLNYENAYTRNFGDRCPAKVVYFSSARELDQGYFLRGEEIFLAEGAQAKPLLNIHRDMNLVGMCNV